ncbi:DUF5602 domain-containing protein [Hymenobacter properus]|uniref:DUF5602 domain-containing protein n=1 Tax=Hymenobacter properus TaxID=2791026 RepID=A0A931BNW1_9BACT|nr:DUF5602 domain-containing protein [Hymenobacter properus]MBF9142870.1 DUF5602 domain-containing protein [Hymenobacter properus]MBR7721677.1 DUF5602 domain-containing protein [Microvirga sp. SRT04]
MRTLKHLIALIAQPLLLAGLSLLVPACAPTDVVAPATPNAPAGDAKADLTRTFYGPAVPVGQGVARAWETVNAAGEPTAIGVDVSAGSMLNAGPAPAEYVLQLPRQVAVPPFDHIELGWNPAGHEPDFYMLPHFDMHFYMITKAAQAAIPFLAPPAFDVAPAAQYIPALYVQGPGLVPNMGSHWLDVLAPELHGETFTKTFIYGTYNGHVAFLEPMFTRAYLSANLSQTTAIRQPAAVEQSGYYPMSYTISHGTTPQQYTISLDGLRYRMAQ